VLTWKPIEKATARGAQQAEGAECLCQIYHDSETSEWVWTVVFPNSDDQSGETRTEAEAKQACESVVQIYGGARRGLDLEPD
jgi:hypothetical protein